ncbi:ABC transporter substrate-binding protein [Klebsiella pneumoniae]|uniref:ABC transporter substrate-binding protein n=1 Tax=Klebsiella pneumoniae TaxID=573 RepID=UPI001BAB736C|nr:ABC transporter substrate-binding protein [Klebsiella pneumoniae]MBS2887371.1 ABC transporter substrate-binding protein [Klebsiella pneumoniae]
MTRTPFSRRRFLQLSGGLALAGVSLPLWAHDMADMAGGDAHPALRLPQPYKIKLAINKSAVCLAPVAVAEQQKIFSKYNLDVEFVNFGSSTDVLLEAIATGKADAGVGMALRWLKALEQGFDVKLTAGTHGGCLNLLTAKDSPFGGLESLKGHTIGVTDMAGPDKNFFAILLKRHGIDPISDVQWKVYPADLLSVAQSFLAHALNTSEAEVSGILHGQGHGHHAVGEAFVKELTQYAVDLQRVQVIKPGTDPHQFAESIYANVFA